MLWTDDRALRLVVVDTGPLADFLYQGFAMTRGGSPDTLGLSLTCLRTREQYEAFEWLLSRVDFVTVPGVFAETHRIIRKALRKNGNGGARMLEDFWKFAREDLMRSCMREEFVRFETITASSLESLGPVDSSLLEAALMLAAEQDKTAIVADDRQLFKACTSRGIRYIWAKELPASRARCRE